MQAQHASPNDSLGECMPAMPGKAGLGVLRSSAQGSVQVPSRAELQAQLDLILRMVAILPSLVRVGREGQERSLQDTLTAAFLHGKA